MAYNDTRTLKVRVTGDTAELSKSLKSASAQQKEFASDMKKGALVLAGAGAALTAYAKSATDFTVDAVRDVKKLARETGETEEETSRLLYVTKRLGLEAGDASAVFGVFAKKIQGASAESKKHRQESEELRYKISKVKAEIKDTSKEIEENGDKTGELGRKMRGLEIDLKSLTGKLNGSIGTFDKLGVSLTDASGKQKGFSELLLDVSDKFKEMPNGVEKTALAMELFGRSGKDMLPVLNLGSDGIKELESNADKLGLTLNAKTIGAVNDYIKSSKDLKDTQDSLKLAVGTLTAPVLTKFQLALNNTMLKLVATDSPFRDATANILAFGGPVAGASASVVGFLGNLSGFAPKLATGIASMGGWVGAIVGSTVATAALSYKLAEVKAKTGEYSMQSNVARLAMQAFTPMIATQVDTFGSLGAVVFRNKFLAQDLKNANDQLRLSEENLKLSTDSLKRAKNDLAGANLGVERAQKNYTAAVRAFGPKSLEAREAAYQLRDAQLRQGDAAKSAKEKTDKLKEAQKRLADQKSQIDTLRRTADEAQNTGNVFGNAARSVGEFFNQLLKGGKSGGSNPLANRPTELKLGKNARGTDNWRGGPTWVGEEGPEIIDAPKGSRIFPAEKSQRIAQQMSQSSATQSTNVQVSLNVNVGMYAGMPVEKREIALQMWREIVRAARAQGVQLPMIGAVGVQ